jgi:hypothetical protein
MKGGVIAALLAVGLASAASANTFTVNHVYDPANVLLFSFSGEALLAPVTLGAGDTLDFTVTFTGGATGTFSDEDFIWPLLYKANGAPNDALNVSGTIQFLGASANLVGTTIPISQINEEQHIGTFIFSNIYRLDSNPISFSGIRSILTINSAPTGPRDYDRVVLTYDRGEFSATSGPGAIPEPASWAMMIAGFMLTGAAMRRRRVVPAA